MTTGRKAVTGGVAAVVGLGSLGLIPTLSGSADESERRSLEIASREISLESADAGHDAGVSGDGSRIVFVAPSATIPDGQAAALDSVWLRDRVADTLTELTAGGDGLRVGATRHPVISRDGCVVAIVTELAFDLFRDDDTGHRWDVYRTVLPGCPGAFAEGEWEIVSTTAVGEPVARDDVNPDDSPALSASGNVIAYSRRAVPDGGDEADWTSIDVVDATFPMGDPERVTTAPGLPDALPETGVRPAGQHEPAMSDDGRFIAFTTDAEIDDHYDEVTFEETITADWPAAPPGSTEVVTPPTQIYRWDRSVNADVGELTLVLVSADAAGSPARGTNSQPSISATGERIAFTASSDVLDPASNELPAPSGAAAQATHVYVAEIASAAASVTPLGDATTTMPDESAFTRTLTLVSRTAVALGNGSSSAPSIDAAGHTVAFVSQADNLVDLTSRRAATSDGGDVILANLHTGTLQRLTSRPDGHGADFGSYRPKLSAAARTIVFDTVVAPEFLGDGVAPSPGPQVISVQHTPSLAAVPIDIGTVAVGLPSPEWETTVSNDGPGGFVPELVVSSNPAFVLSGGTCIARVAVPAGGSCTVRVIFTPLADGRATSTITLTEAGFGAQSVTVEVAAAGGTPTLISDPASQSLGRGVVGSNVDVEGIVTVTNIGPFVERIVRVERSGADVDDFPVLANDCANAVLGPGARCSVTVGFSPGGNGRRSAIVTITSEAGASTSAIVGGDGRFAPLIGVDRTVVDQGGMVNVGGMGFPPNTGLTIGWTGETGTTPITTDDNGAFVTNLTVISGSPTGPRSVIVVDPTGQLEPMQSESVFVNAARRTLAPPQNRRRP